MAVRPVFLPLDHAPYYSELPVDFAWKFGLSDSLQAQNILSLRQAFETACPGKSILEISTKSPDEAGRAASTYQLQKYVPSFKGKAPLECVLQSCKVFVHGGPCDDLLHYPPQEAVRDLRLKECGPLVSYRYEAKDYPLEPQDAFYNYLYVNALAENEQLALQLAQYDAFSEIAFNPAKNTTCQARAVAIFLSLRRLGLLDKAASFDSFAALFAN